MNGDEQLDEALNRIAASEHAHDIGDVPAENRELIQMAQLLRGRAGGSGPRDGFADELAANLRKPAGRPVSRRTAVMAGLGAVAAGVAAGIGIDHSLNTRSPEASSYEWTPLVGTNGRWQHVLEADELAEGGVHAFQAGALAGFLVRKGGQIRAVSAICTHMGCRLAYERKESAFVCPCHGAEFHLNGRLRRYDAAPGTKLAPLPDIKVRVVGTSIEVWTA
jgi:nitrite reductase/ring-hydroxylating ferredoxin subunit